jgi:lipoprotein-anchoring transpeptidase ErfK/SrfK
MTARRLVLIVVAFVITLVLLAFIVVGTVGDSGSTTVTLPPPQLQVVTFTPTITPIPTLTPTVTPSPTPTPTTALYQVKSGDTLESVAGQFGLTVYDLSYANGFDQPNLWHAGEHIIIPSVPVMLQPDHVGKRILIVLSEQMLYAYEDGVLLANLQISSGKLSRPTVIGKYQVYYKLEVARMTGPGYDISDVPWTMYFHLGYGIHGAYWHNNFGTPVSSGCVNLRPTQAEWLYRWAPLGTPVEVIP